MVFSNDNHENVTLSLNQQNRSNTAEQKEESRPPTSSVSTLENTSCTTLFDCVIYKNSTVLSERVCYLKKGSLVMVTHEEGDYVHIQSPVNGWCTRSNLQVSHEADTSSLAKEAVSLEAKQNEQVDLVESMQVDKSQVEETPVKIISHEAPMISEQIDLMQTMDSDSAAVQFSTNAIIVDDAKDSTSTEEDSQPKEVVNLVSPIKQKPTHIKPIARPPVKRKRTFTSFNELASPQVVSEDESSSEDEGEFGFRKLPYPKFDRSYEISAAFNSGVFGSFHRPEMPELRPAPVKRPSPKPREIMTRSKKRSRQEMEESSSEAGDGLFDPQIEDIMKKRRLNGRTQFLVRWTHLAHPKWEYEERLEDHQRAVRSFERRVKKYNARKRAPGTKPVRKKQKEKEPPTRKETRKRKRNTSKAKDKPKKRKLPKPRLPVATRSATEAVYSPRQRQEPSSGQLHIPPEVELPSNHPQLVALKKIYREDSKARTLAAASLYKTAQDIMAVLNPTEDKPITISGPEKTCKDNLEKVRTAFTKIIEPHFSMLFETNNRMKREISQYDSENRKLLGVLNAYQKNMENNQMGGTLPKE